MILTEPVQCSTCKSVSVNGGIVHCNGCYAQLQAENARLRKAIEEAPMPTCFCPYYAGHIEHNGKCDFCKTDKWKRAALEEA